LSLKPIEFLQEVFPDTSRQAAYRIAREYPEFVVRVGRRIFVNEERLSAFLEGGGRAFPGGWRKDPARADLDR